MTTVCSVFDDDFLVHYESKLTPGKCEENVSSWDEFQLKILLILQAKKVEHLLYQATENLLRLFGNEKSK